MPSVSRRSRAPVAGLRLVRALLVLLVLGGAGLGASGGAAEGSSAPNARGCTTAFAAAPHLTARRVFVDLAGSPFGIAVTRDHRWSFVAETDSGLVAVLSTARFRPRPVRTISVPVGVEGDALTPDGRYLLVADGGNGAIVLSVSRAKAGTKHVVLGRLRQPGGGAGGAIEVATSPDGRYAFVSVEFEARIAVYDLRAALAHRFGQASYVGSIPVGQLVDGLAVSPDGRWLYATSEIGSLAVIKISIAERTPSRSVITTTPAGCNPTRVVPAPDGSAVWVADRGGDRLLAFSATKLRTDPADSQLADVAVGEAPVGLAFVKGGRDLIVADSNRFGTPGATAQLTVVRTSAAMAHHAALLGTIPTGTFPRELAVEPGRPTLLVGNFGSDQLEAVDLTHLP